MREKGEGGERTMAEESAHGFCTREGWTRWFTEYNLVISDLNDSSYALIQEELPAAEWVKKYEENSARVRRAYGRNEEMLDRHVRWFTRTPGRWTRQTADPLLAFLFRYVTRMQDMGTVGEIADSLLGFFGPLKDDVALMKCYTVRAFSDAFLDPIHLADRAYADCAQAAEIYERRFLQLTPEEQSMGLSIYDLEFDRFTTSLKLQKATPDLLEQMIAAYTAASKAAAHVRDTDQGYEFNTIIPDFDHYLGFAALCLQPGQCTRQQAQAIYRAAAHRWAVSRAAPGMTGIFRVRVGLVYRMAQHLLGQCSGETVLGEIKELMGEVAGSLLAENTAFSQHAIEAVEAIQLAAETLTHGGKAESALYHQVQTFFIEYLATRPYTALVDYICCSYNYCYILTALPHAFTGEELLQALLKLTMFRQVQTAMHMIMVGKLALEVLESIFRRRPQLLVGQLGTRDTAEVLARRDELRRYVYRGALLHDIGKLLCSSVINAQSHRLGELEFEALKFHPVTGGEMLEQLPELSAFRDIALGHQKSFDGRSGYPAGFDNTASPQKVLIDLITLCDSLDAATDHLGRNYATAKSFGTVLEELRAGRDTRYSGALVSLLEEDGALQQKLSQLVGEGRRKVYYNVHRMILAESSGRLGKKQIPAWLFDLGAVALND